MSLSVAKEQRKRYLAVPKCSKEQQQTFNCVTRLLLGVHLNCEEMEPDNSKSGPSTSSATPNDGPGGGDAPGSSLWECNICLDIAKDAVVTTCGHLFCWPCLHQWLETKPMRPTCPVCKSAVTREQVIPLYGRGSDKKDPREKKIPPRPQGQRTEQSEYNTFPNFGFGDGFHMSFGIGAFPFGFFASTFNIGDFRANPAMVNGVDMAQDQFISKLFLWVAMIFIVWLLLA